MTPLFSIVIATYNRADLLKLAIQSVCDQTLDPAEFKLIVVDNNSTDNTRSVIDAFCTNHPNILYLFEAEPGSSLARNKGCRQAQGKYIAFIDDDCKVPPDWLAKAKSIIEQQAPGILGGPYYAFYTTPKPAWFQDSYGSYEPSDKAGPLANPSALATGNLFVRRDLFLASGGFSTDYGITAQTRIYGDETAMLWHIHTTNPGLLSYYAPTMFVYHWVQPRKLSLWWQLRDIFQHGLIYHSIYGREDQPFTWQSLLLFPFHTLLVGLRTLVGSWLWRDRTRYPYWQNYLYESKALNYCLRRMGMWFTYVQSMWPLCLLRRKRHGS